MRIAFTISSYRLTSFVRLGILQIKSLFPDSPILVSDDPSPESPEIQKTCDELGCAYRGANKRRGHFAGDFQSLVNSLIFAEAIECDVAVKVSQRFIFRKPEAMQVIVDTFDNNNIMAATPGQPKITGQTRTASGFGAFTTLSDVVFLRVGAMSAEQLLHLYRGRLIRETVPWASFIECVVDEIHTIMFPGRTKKIEEFTNPNPIHDPIYLRRYQASEKMYHELAAKHNMGGIFPLNEWGQIENRDYFCRPAVI